MASLVSRRDQASQGKIKGSHLLFMIGSYIDFH